MTDTAELPVWRRTLRLRRAQALAFLRHLGDLEFTELLTPRMLPTLYLLGIAASAYAVIVYTIEGFTVSATLGFMRLLLLGPVAFLVLVTLCRVALELCLAVFRIAVHINEMAGHTSDIAGLSGSLPKITFWRAAKKKPGADPAGT